MADTVKKSRIVSESEEDAETNLEEAFLEEFNMRLKNCMSNDDLKQHEDPPEHTTNLYENITTKTTTQNGISASQTFINNEKCVEENLYDEPKPVVTIKNGKTQHQNGNHNHKNQHNIDSDEEEGENIYENIPEKTETTDQNLIIKDLDLGVTESEYEVVINTETNIENKCYDIILPTKQEEEIDDIKPNLAFILPTTCFTDFSELQEAQPDVVDNSKSAKDRMLLSCDDTSTLLFTQTVTSPMLTPSEENIDFLKGFQRDNTISDSASTNTSVTPPKDDKTNDEIEEKQDTTSDVSELNNLVEDNNAVYQNLEFLMNNVAQIDNEENIYENIEEFQSKTDEPIYQNINECVENEDIDTDKGSIEEFLRNEQLAAEEATNNVEELQDIVLSDHEVHNEDIILLETHENCTNETLTSNVEKIKEQFTQQKSDSYDSNNETYKEFVFHSKTDMHSNYYEKYTEVITKSSKSEVSNREKDTETVPAEIVKQLKSQFLHNKPAEVVGITKKEQNRMELKLINVSQKIDKFEQKDDATENLDDSNTEYSETIVESNAPGEIRMIKKKKTKKTRTSEKENISVKSSFSKFDALQKKNVLHVRSSDSSKAQEKFNGAQMDLTSCKKCEKQVFQMEQIKAERAVWHKNCFRCTECSKQLSGDAYESHEGSLYCKPHFKALFAPKAVEEEAPQRPRKPELIIRENQPVELPPGVVRASDKPDLGLEELQSLNVKERFQVFEHHQTETSETDRGPTPVNVKRSPSILSKLAKFQKHGMDVGVSNEALDGIPIEESSSEEEEEEEVIEGEDAELIRAKKVQKEKPFHFTGMSDVKKRWEMGDQGSTRDERREETKQEIQSIRNRLFMGKQEKMKEAYQQAIMESESSSNVRKNITENIEICDTKSIKERFEKGEVVKGTQNKGRNDDEEVFESEISKKSRSLFLELDAGASKPPQLSPITPPKLEVKKAREAETPEREIYRDPDVVRGEEFIEDSTIAKETHTATKMLTKFRQMQEESHKEPQSQGLKPLKRFTPPLEPARPESNSEEEEESEEEYEEEEEEEEVDHNRLPEDLIEAQKAARAKQLRAKFEKWEANEIKKEQQNSVNIVEPQVGEEQSIESTRVLRARFESMKETSSTETTRSPRVKVHRFV